MTTTQTTSTETNNTQGYTADEADEYTPDEGVPTECVYCMSDVIHRDAASLADDEAWGLLAREHDKECEWVLTRAHRRDAVKP